MKPPPTDFQLLRAIYERHRGDYLTSIKKGGHAKIAVPIDIPAIAQDIGADADTVFGRLFTTWTRSTGPRTRTDPASPLHRAAGDDEGPDQLPAS